LFHFIADLVIRLRDDIGKSFHLSWIIPDTPEWLYLWHGTSLLPF
jgi:hypothetical protein